MSNKNIPKDSVVSSTSATTEQDSYKEQIDSDSNSNDRPRHDELFKKVMSEPVAAREFLVNNVPRLGIMGTFYETIKFKIYRLTTQINFFHPKEISFVLCNNAKIL
ncbi:hypothetical protein [Rickettsia hoogstraalii]|uniref:hypothetical protein n=1 Tax=Rickettsia hoogstraalii TaxID=467174 RepID=UPI00058EA4D1